MKKILLVEDDQGLREMYQMRLELENFSVVCAIDGEEALEKAKNEKPDLILLDLMIPKISGLEVLKMLKNDTLTAKIPVIIMTVLDQENNKIEGLSLGADDYIIKSKVMPEEVLERIKKVLKNN